MYYSRILTILTILIGGYIFIPNIANSQEYATCESWLELNVPNQEIMARQQSIIASCDNSSFTVLNQSHAKDNNYVYFKPAPDKVNLVIILKDADPYNFIAYEKCPDLGIDGHKVYSKGQIHGYSNPEKVREQCQ